MEKIKTTPKDFFLWAGAMIALYVSIGSLISLLFDYINITFPDIASYLSVDSYASSVRFAMSALFILTPVFLVLMYVIRRDITATPEKKDLWVRRWALVGTVFFSGATMIIDLITLMTSFLNGELTTHFILKVVVVFLVASLGFMHFLADMWGFWIQYPRRAQAVGLSVAILIILTIISGFFMVGSPNEARLARLDTQKVNDLESIQSNIISYWQNKSDLPKTLHDVGSDTLSGYVIPEDSQINKAYEYRIIRPLTFELCAEFNTVSSTMLGGTPSGYAAPENNDVWYHGAGHVCFIRTIDPDIYKPNNPPVKDIPTVTPIKTK